MSYPQLSSGTPSAAESLLARIVSVFMSVLLAALGLVFALCLLLWLFAMVVISLISGWITGRPSTVSLLWQRYRDMTRRVSRPRWAQRAGSTAGDAAARSSGNVSSNTDVQDVAWRDVSGPSS